VISLLLSVLLLPNSFAPKIQKVLKKVPESVEKLSDKPSRCSTVMILIV